MRISEFVFKNKAIFYFLLVCIVVGGIISYQSISKLEDPEIVVMQAKVITVYPGATAHEVEMQVTNIIENELSSLSNIDNITSQSSANISVVTVSLELSVPQKGIEQRWDFLRRKVDAVTPKLPEGVQIPIVYDDFGDVYGMFYAMLADGFSYKEMAIQADYIKNEMLAIDGVSKVQVYGEQTPCIDIKITPEKMGEMGILPFQIISAINGQNAKVYAGSLYAGTQLLKVVVNDKLSSLEDIENLLIKGVDGGMFKLSDIATIEESYNEPFRNTMFLNNKKAIGISVSMESGENIVTLGDRVEKRLEELQADIPIGYEFEKVFFQPDKVKASINGFMKNLILSVLIVIIVLMIVMGMRSGLIIGSGLLLTILATFPFLLAAEGSLQRISLGAFIVAMGMLVDNAIVVIDGIVVGLQKGVKSKNIYLKSVKRTAWPLLGATIIAVSAFLPVYLSKDAAGTYSKDLFLVLCISLFISWILAITQVPVFSKKFLKIKNKKKNSNPHNAFMHRFIRKILMVFLKYKTATLIVSALILALAIYNFKNVKKTFFPDFNYNQVYIEYKLSEGTNPEKVNDDLRKITNHFLTYDEVKMVVSSQGMTPTRYCLVRAMGDMSDSYGELIVNFEDYENMVKMKPVFSKYLNENFPEAYSRIRKYNLSIKASHTVEVEFMGPDPAILQELSRQARGIMQRSEYADPFTVCDDWEPMGQSLVARYDLASATRAGVSRSDVSNALLAATDGLPFGEYFEGETRVKLNLKIRNTDGSRIQDLNDVPVWAMIPNISGIDKNSIRGLMTGTKSIEELTKEIVSPVPLSSVSTGVGLNWEESIVRRNNGKRAIQAQCDPVDGCSPALLRNTILNDVESIELPRGYSMRWVGEQELQSDALSNIFKFLPISLMIILLTLILLFNDFKKPAIVLLCIPMSAIGIVAGLAITGLPFTFMAIVGSFGLIGMLIKNSIVLLDEIGKLIAEGVGQFDAILTATVSRARPVIMASFTTILGMLPLISDPMYASMAVTIISGLLVGTIITLVFVPILYATFFKVKKNGFSYQLEK